MSEKHAKQMADLKKKLHKVKETLASIQLRENELEEQRRELREESDEACGLRDLYEGELDDLESEIQYEAELAADQAAEASS